MLRHAGETAWMRFLVVGTFTLALGLAIPYGARADEPVGQALGSVTLSQLHNEGARYDAYRVFGGQVAPDGTATHLSWASDKIREVTLAYIDSQGYESWLAERHADGQHDLAQNAAEFVANQMATVEASVEDDDSAVVGAPFGLGLAQAFANSDVTPDGIASTDEPFEGEQGLWLFVTNDATTEAPSEAGTLPLWLPLGSEATQATEKSAIPTVTIEVCEDSTGSWRKTADAQRQQQVDLRVTGTLPSNFTSFDRYHYRLDIRLPKGMTLDVPSDGGLAKALGITVGGKQVAPDDEACFATLDDGLLVIDFPDLRATRWQEVGLNADARIGCGFKAHLNDEAPAGMPGNAIEASLTYTDDPVSQNDGHTGADRVTVFAYQMNLLKVAEQTKEALEGAEFTLQVSPENTDEPSRGRYVRKDGSLADTPEVLTTDAKGQLCVSGLDEGVYLVRETAAPVGYAALPSDIILTVSSTLSDMDQALVELTASSSLEAAPVSQVEPDTATVILTVRDAKLPASPRSGSAERLPQTGVAPIAGTLVALGITIAGISLIRRRT